MPTKSKRQQRKDEARARKERQMAEREAMAIPELAGLDDDQIAAVAKIVGMILPDFTLGKDGSFFAFEGYARQRLLEARALARKAQKAD